MQNRLKLEVEVIGTYRLILDIGHILDLHDTFCVPSIFRNLFSLSRLDLKGYTYIFVNHFLKIYLNSILVGFGISCDDLHKVNLDNLFAQSLLTLHVNVGLKRSISNENLSMLWHKR